MFGGSESESPVLFGDQKFCILSCGVWGIRNSESPVLFGGSEILYPLLWCVGEQKFWNSCVVWGIRNSESSPVLFREQKFWTLSCVISVKTISFTSSQFYTHFQGNFKICNVKKMFLKTRFYLKRKRQPFLRWFSVFPLNFTKLEHHILLWKALFFFRYVAQFSLQFKVVSVRAGNCDKLY